MSRNTKDYVWLIVLLIFFLTILFSSIAKARTNKHVHKSTHLHKKVHIHKKVSKKVTIHIHKKPTKKGKIKIKKHKHVKKTIVRTPHVHVKKHIHKKVHIHKTKTTPTSAPPVSNKPSIEAPKKTEEGTQEVIIPEPTRREGISHMDLFENITIGIQVSLNLGTGRVRVSIHGHNRY